MSLQLLKRLGGSNKIQSLDVLPQRFCQIFQVHGVERSQIPRLMPQITLGDLKSNETLLAALTPEILDQTARLFGIRSEWLEGVDDDIYAYRHCYKDPELLLDLLATLRNQADSDWPHHFPMRVLVSNKHLDSKTDREQLLVPVVLEKIAELGDEPIYRYYIFNDSFRWEYEPARIQLKAMVRTFYKALRTPVPLMVIKSADLQSVLDRKKISREFLDGCLVTTPSLEDFSLTSQESVVAAELDELPKVLKYIEDHKLEGYFTNARGSASLLQDAPPEAQQPAEVSTPAASEPKTGKRANNAQQLWEPVKAVASALWAEDASLTIAEVISRIKQMPHLKAAALSDSAIRKNIADLAPGKDSAKPGRRHKKSP
ncbi:MAG: hypothetical protein K0M48_14400 [Thiobacillus sp.]|nr:hypothetical protein [Thiobacillus sp.]